MGIVSNILSVPVSRQPFDQGLYKRSFDPAAFTDGTLYTGHTRVFAQLQPDVSGTARISFSIDVNTVLTDTFLRFRIACTEFLGALAEQAVSHQAGIPPATSTPEAWSSNYSRTAYAYAATGRVDALDGKDSATLQPKGIHGYDGVMQTIHTLDSHSVTLTGSLEARVQNPNVAAYVAVTFFEFTDGTVTSFVGYRGPIVLVVDEKETETQAGILTPA